MRPVTRLSKTWLGTLLAVTVLALAACSDQPAGQTFKPIPLEDFPAGIGRGYPRALVYDDGIQAATDSPAPAFALVLENGQGIRLEELQGKPIVLNFWATWCIPCREEMPDLIALSEENEGVHVLAANVQEQLAQIEPFTEEFQVSMPVVRDEEGELRRAFGVRSLPTTVFIDSQGRIASRWNGMLTEEILHDRIAELK